MQRVPLLVAITGHDQAEEPGRAVRAGFDHYLVKPVDPSVLLDLLARV
jgi:CheY-like chemotaxis protein